MQLKSNSLLQGGKYRIEKVLGQGGFGITYQATQVALNRKVAIKEFFMKEYCNRDEETSRVSIGSEGSKELVGKFRQKFIKEAQTIAEMENNHIIRIHDVFEENGTAYYVMEYLSGGDLRSRIPHAGLSEAEAMDYIRQIGEALAYIHSKNILHLDIKPMNIMFRHSGEAVLIDFGISKHYDDNSGGQTSSTPVGISEGYAPMEQYDREVISSFSAATDVYSLGATLYCLLNGSRPPKASIVLNEGLPELPAKVSAPIRQAVKRAMAPRRKDRPQSVSEFLGILNVEMGIESLSEEETEVTITVKENKSKKDIAQILNTKSSGMKNTLSIMFSLLKTRNKFVNVILFLTLGLAVYGMFFNLWRYREYGFDSYLVITFTNIGIAVGIWALLMNRRWGFYFTLLAATAECLWYIFWEGGWYSFFILRHYYCYIPIWIGLVLLIRKDGKSAWSMQTINSFFLYMSIKILSVLLLFAFILYYFSAKHTDGNIWLQIMSILCYD